MNSNKNKQIYFVRLRIISLLNKLALIRNETDNHWKLHKYKKRGRFRPSLCSFESYDNLFDSENLLKELLYTAFSLLFLHVSSILVRCGRTIFSLWAIAFFVVSFYICTAFLVLLLFRITRVCSISNLIRSVASLLVVSFFTTWLIRFFASLISISL